MLAHRYLEDMEAYPAHKQPATTRHKLICLHLREHTWHIRRSNAHSRQFCRSQWCEIATPAVSCFYGSEREAGKTCILRGFLKGTYFRSAGRPNSRFSPEWPINRGLAVEMALRGRNHGTSATTVLTALGAWEPAKDAGFHIPTATATVAVKSD